MELRSAVDGIAPRLRHAQGTEVTTLYTMVQVAERLHKSRRWLQSFLRDHPYYRLAGRSKVFTEADITKLVESLPCPSNSYRPVKASRRTSRSAAHTLKSTLTEALELANERF